MIYCFVVKYVHTNYTQKTLDVTSQLVKNNLAKVQTNSLTLENFEAKKQNKTKIKILPATNCKAAKGALFESLGIAFKIQHIPQKRLLSLSVSRVPSLVQSRNGVFSH